jgi:hypothetical protein
MFWMMIGLLAAPFGGPRPLPANECGAPVRDEGGRAILYSRSEWEALPCVQPAGSRVTREPSVPSLETPDPARWGYASFGSMVASSQVLLAPAPPAAGWGPTEVYLGGSTSTFGLNDYWHALRYSPAREGYEDVFVSARMPAGIARLAVADIAGDARLEIVAALRSGQIVIYDQPSKRLLPGFSAGLSDLTSVALRDLDADGKAEVVAVSSGQLRVFSGGGVLRWQLGVGGADVVVGQMDGDPSLEIAVAGGSVVDVTSRAVQWTRASGFGLDVEAADVDGDGMEELIAAPRWDFVWAYDVDTQLPKWSLPVDLDIAAIHLAQLDADPAVELMVSQYQQAKLDVYDTLTQALQWSVTTQDSGISPVAIGNVDADAGLELLFGSGFSSTGDDHLYVADLATRAFEWSSIHLDGPFLGPERGDVDGDGRAELVFASTESESGYVGGRILVVDTSTLAVRAVSAGSQSDLTGLHDLKLRNVDTDAALEIVVATDNLYDGQIRIYDFDGPSNTFSLRWTNSERPFGLPFHSVEVADLDLDGNLEVIAGGGREHTGAEGVFVYVFDLATGQREWRTFQLGDYWSKVTAVAVLRKGGGHPDLVAMVGDGSIYVFDGVTRASRQIIAGTFTALGSASAVGRAFLAGTATGLLQRYERTTGNYAPASEMLISPMRIEGAHTLDKNGLVAVGQGDVLSLYRWGNPVPRWTSASYGFRLGRSLARDERYWYSGGGHAVVAFSPRYPMLSSLHPREAAWRRARQPTASTAARTSPYPIPTRTGTTSNVAPAAPSTRWCEATGCVW